jgi:hypothetical protein
MKELVVKEILRMVRACGGKEDIMWSYNGNLAQQRWHGFEDPTSRAGYNFDGRILGWYFATKMFFSLSSRVEARQQDDVEEIIEAMSSYMMFLLVERPHMLPSPVSPGLCANAEATYVRLGLSGVKDLIERIREHSRRREALLRRRKHMETLYRNQHMDGLEERSIRREELDTTNELDRRIEELYRREDLLEQDRRREDQSVVSRGAELAGRLLDMEARGEQEVRQVVLGVWVEMLCYAAHHCNRDSHASQLNSGGEFITIVWLLSAAMFNS